MGFKEKIEAANQKCLEVINRSNPVWVDVIPAREVLPGLGEKMILHAGPPISFEDMCSAQQKGVMGAAVYEGWAETLEEAGELARRGEIQVDPCHHHQAVGSMTGITSPSMPVMMVEDKANNTTGHILVHEGPSRERLGYGFFSDKVKQNLKWIETVLGPALQQVVRAMGGIPVNPIIAQSLTMGDECHNRPTAGSALLFTKIMPTLCTLDLERESLAQIVEFLAKTEHFFFHLGMAASKATTDACNGVEFSTMVTAMARNGIETGIRVSGIPDKWFTGPASKIDGVYFPSYGPEDATNDMGDSAIMETMGLGAFALPASIPMARAVGGSTSDAVNYLRQMEEITLGKHNLYQIPMLDFERTPVGIDIRKVVKTGILPIIDTAIAHKDGGEIGVGLATPPIECFQKAVKEFSIHYGL